MPREEGLRASNRRKAIREIQGRATRLVRERGHASTTIEDIAAAAGVSESSVCRHFSRDDQLPEALVRLIFEEPSLLAAFAQQLEAGRPIRHHAR
ncbi:MAG: TetR/AcrR family transcriptional regulator [Deltaproteobacteria bacterium]|jgi:AcrR family transcriptional regulator|nr:TetR/AcrR family transcriptional regulator [Deltaproteobacteria bacterium]